MNNESEISPIYFNKHIKQFKYNQQCTRKVISQIDFFWLSSKNYFSIILNNMLYFLINLITEVSETLYIFFNNNIIIDINQL